MIWHALHEQAEGAVMLALTCWLDISAVKLNKLHYLADTRTVLGNLGAPYL